jgi:hypothetical protein
MKILLRKVQSDNETATIPEYSEQKIGDYISFSPRDGSVCFPPMILFSQLLKDTLAQLLKRSNMITISISFGEVPSHSKRKGLAKSIDKL